MSFLKDLLYGKDNDEEDVDRRFEVDRKHKKAMDYLESCRYEAFPRFPFIERKKEHVSKFTGSVYRHTIEYLCPRCEHLVDRLPGYVSYGFNLDDIAEYGFKCKECGLNVLEVSVHGGYCYYLWDD